MTDTYMKKIEIQKLTLSSKLTKNTNIGRLQMALQVSAGKMTPKFFARGASLQVKAKTFA